jgi:hypothetical protein
MSQAIEEFRKILVDPETPLKVRTFVELATYDGTPKEKINYFWCELKFILATQERYSDCLKEQGLDQNEELSQRLQKFFELKKELSQFRQTSYRDYVQVIEKEELLEEAQTYYLQSFSQIEREEIKASVEQMTLDAILPKLKERVLAQTIKDFDLIEIQEIISQIEKV